MAPNPYVGPRPLDTGERIFGRDREIKDLYYLLSAERIVLLHSPSGAGKSSLIQAGLIPRMRREFDVWRPTRVSTPPPERAAPGVNRYVLSACLGFEQGVPEGLRRPVEQLAGQTLVEYVRHRPRRPSAPENLLLIFDQFEELLTIDPLLVGSKEGFFDELGMLLRDRRIWALFSIREDYLAAFAPYAERVPTQLQNRFRIDRLTLDAAAGAIAEPARAAGRPFTGLALAQLVHDLARVRVQQPDGSFEDRAGLYVEALQLQVVCSGMWKALPADTVRIDRKCVRRYGNVTGALAGYYAAEVGRLAAGGKRVEQAVRQWVDAKLILAGGIRGQVLKGQTRTEGLENRLIEGLENAHLIRGEQRANATWYELSHDRLIEPVQTNNREWLEANLHPVQKTAAAWEQEGQPEGLLFLGDDLESARQWQRANQPHPNDRESRFIAASEGKQRRIRDEEEARRRKLRGAWSIAAALGLLSIACAGFAWFAVTERNRAERNMQTAVDAVDEMLLSAGQESGRVAAEIPEVQRFRRELLSKAKIFYDRFLQQKPGREDLLREMAEAHFRLGDIYRLDQQAPLAIREYTLAAGAFAGLSPGNSNHLADREQEANAYNWLGETQRIVGKLPEAERAYNAALAIQRELHALQPPNENYARDLARTYYNRGIVRANAGDAPGADGDYLEAIKLLEQLSDLGGGYRQELDRAYNDRANLLNDIGRTAEAEALYRKAIDAHLQLLKNSPSNRDLELELDQFGANLALLYSDAQRFELAAEAWRESHRQVEALARPAPSVAVRMAKSYLVYATILNAQGKLPQAADEYNRSIQLLAGIDSGDLGPASRAYHLTYGEALDELARLRLIQRDPAAAVPLLTNAIPQNEASGGGSALAWDYANLASAQLDRGLIAEAGRNLDSLRSLLPQVSGSSRSELTSREKAIAERIASKRIAVTPNRK